MEQVITVVACAVSGLLQTNTRKPRNPDKPRTQDGGKIASWIGTNVNLNKDYE